MRKCLLIWVMFLLGLNAAAQLTYVGKSCIQNPNDALPNDGTQGCAENVFLFDHTPGGREWTWDFGYTANSGSAFFIPTAVGSQTISYTVTKADGSQENKSMQVVTSYYPNQPLFENKTSLDTTICGGKKITLDPYKGRSAPAGVTYKWFPNGETTSTLEVDEPGCYSVEVIDPISGCSRSAKVNVKVCMEQDPSGGGSEKWYFGDGSGIEFDLSYTELPIDSLADEGSLDPQPELEDPIFTPTVPNTINESRAKEASAMVFDKSGQLALYTDGKKVYSGVDDQEIPFVGTNPLQDRAGTQGLALVPKPICSSCDYVNYYLFYVDKNTSLLNYLTIDMRTQDRRGEVIGEPVPVAAEISDKLNAERSADNLSYFLSVYVPHAGTFQSIGIDSLGLISVLPTVNPPAPNTVSSGYVAVSSSGDQMAHGLVKDGQNVVQIFSRDPATNQTAFIKEINLNVPAPPTIYGLAFSPNGQFLYVSLQGDGTINSQLWQVDINAETGTLIIERPEIFGALALGPKYGAGEKLVYLTIDGQNTIHYFQEPDEPGAASAFTWAPNSAHPGVRVPGTTRLGFPNVVGAEQDQQSDGLEANYVGNCFNQPTRLYTQDVCSPMKNDVEWEVEGKKYKGKEVSHTFSRIGWHDIKMKVRIYRETQAGSTLNNNTGGLTGNLLNDFCTEIEFKGRIYIKPSPNVRIAEPLFVCVEPPYNGKLVQPEVSGGESFTYAWYTGAGVLLGPPNHDPYEKDQLFYTAQNFIFEVTNNYNCMVSRNIKLEQGCEPIIEIPTAITPDGQGPIENETLKVIHHFIERPVLQIFNRWGEQVYETDDLTKEWDGSFKGKIYSPQLYAYVLKYYARDFPHLGEQKKVGSVLVLTQ